MELKGILIALYKQILEKHRSLDYLPDKVLIIAPHPDDEIFGLGGCIIKLNKQGSEIHIIYLTDGENTGVWPDKNEIKLERIRLSEKVCSNLGIPSSNIFRLHLTDGSVPHSGQAEFGNTVNVVRSIIEKVNPDAVFATHTLDYWPFDHIAAAQIAKESIDQLNIKPELWLYLVWAWYNVRPWYIFSRHFRKLIKIDVRDSVKQKQELMSIYLNSITPEGKPWIGLLPPQLLNVFKFPFEIVERII